MKFKKGENLSFFPQCVLENIMMTSLLADKSVIVKIKIIMNFMNEIIIPLISHVLQIKLRSMSEDSIIFLAEISSSQADNKSAVQAAVSPYPFAVPEDKNAGERGKESPVGGPEGPTEVGGVCATEAGTEDDSEDEDEDLDVVGGVDEVGVSGYESEGFTLSEILRRKRLEKKVSEGVVDTAHLPQCEFSNIHYLPLALLLEFFCWPVMKSIGLVMLPALEYEDDFVRLLCFSVQSLRRTCGSCQ